MKYNNRELANVTTFMPINWHMIYKFVVANCSSKIIWPDCEFFAIETQDQFIAILSVTVAELSGLFQIVDSSTLSANMFLKHLIVLADFGGEMIKRVNSQFNSLFLLNRLGYLWNLQTYSYQFTSLPVTGQLTNNKLGIDGKKNTPKLIPIFGTQRFNNDSFIRC